MRMAQKFVRYSETDAATKKLLETHTFYFIPRPSPDACEKCFARPFRERSGNDRPTDDDRDFQTGDDPPDDLNGDGSITMMRIEDETGQWLPHPDDPRVLIQADRKKGERGKYRLLVEGKDDDHDENWNEDGGDGVAFNSNFTFRYEPFSKGTGASAISEPENRAVAEFLYDRNNIAVVFSFSPEDNLLNPWKPNPEAEKARIKTTVLAADAPVFEFLSSEYKKAHGGSDPPESSAGRGSFSDWAYFHYGRWSLASRGWWIPKVAAPKVDVPKPADGAEVKKPPDDKKTPDDKKPMDDKRGNDDLNALRWFTRENLDGFANWTAIEHPDFAGKKVEVGGFRPFFRLNPPAALLEDLVDKHVKFLSLLPNWLPEISIGAAKAESLGGGVVRVEATVINQGFLPTMPAMGRENGAPFPLWAELSLPEKTQFLQGHARTRLPRLDGGGKTERTWLLRFDNEAPKTIEIKVHAPAVGSASRSVEIR
jgi:hypothetical protein